MIGAGLIVANDVEEMSFIYMKQEHVVKKNSAKIDIKSRDSMRKKL